MKGGRGNSIPRSFTRSNQHIHRSTVIVIYIKVLSFTTRELLFSHKPKASA